MDQPKPGDEVVYFVAIRSTAPKDSTEVRVAMKALNEAGLLPTPPMAASNVAVAWARPYEELTANDNAHLCALGLDWDDANRIVTVAAVAPA